MSSTKPINVVSASVLVILIMLVALFIWLQRKPHKEVPERAAEPPVEQEKPVSPPAPSPPEEPPSPKPTPLIARAAWSTDPHAALGAIPIEPTRGEVREVDLSRRTTMSLSLPLYSDAGQKYSRYRIMIAAGEKRVWQQMLRAPVVSLTGNAHILNVVLSPGRLPQTISLDLRVEGFSLTGWQALGHVTLNQTKR